MSAFHDSALIGASGQGEYQIQRSLRFNSIDSAFLSTTFTSAGNRKTWTWAGWVKRSAFGQKVLFSAAPGSQTVLWFENDALEWTYYSGGYIARLTTNAVYRDASAWMHVVFALDTTQATANDRMKLYVNGLEVTSFLNRTNPLLNADYDVNNNVGHNIGYNPLYSAPFFSGYLADIHFIDGQALAPTSFGFFDGNGIWQPKAYSGGSYGTNGFHLPLNDNSTAAALGTDTSGNGNTWTVNNISVAAGAGNDSLVDSPTNYGTDTGVGNEVRGNYATLNPLASAGTMSNGNLDGYNAANTTSHASMAMPSSGKWYFEGVMTSGNLLNLGLASYRPNGHVFNISNSVLYSTSGVKNVDGALDVPYGASWTTGDIIGVACDSDANTVTFYKNGVSQGAISHQVGGLFPSFGNGGIDVSYTANFGQRPFAYPAPSGFKALCTANLDAPVVTKPSEYMDVKLWTGNGSSQSITTDFSPDFVWIKQRNGTSYNTLQDIVRGATKDLYSNTTDAEGTYAQSLNAFNSNGFTLGNAAWVNGSSNTYVGWAWDAGNTTVTNNDGSITSTVRANATAGFSVVAYTGTGANATVGHGLGVAPSLIIAKASNNVDRWNVFSATVGADKYLNLGSTDPAFSDPNVWNNTSPTSTVFSLGTDSAINGLYYYVAYCFASVEGYSAFGSYTGNGSADGPFVFCNFRPRWVLWKRTDTAVDWLIVDSQRDSYNVTANYLRPNLSNAELSEPPLFDFTSNGFKVRAPGTYLGTNASGGTYIYAAFAENPFSLARAR